MFAANFWVKNLGHNLLRDHLILTKISFFTEKYDLTFEHFLAKKNALMDTLTYSALKTMNMYDCLNPKKAKKKGP